MVICYRRIIPSRYTFRYALDYELKLDTHQQYYSSSPKTVISKDRTICIIMINRKERIQGKVIGTCLERQFSVLSLFPGFNLFYYWILFNGTKPEGVIGSNMKYVAQIRPCLDVIILWLVRKTPYQEIFKAIYGKEQYILELTRITTRKGGTRKQ